MRLLFSVKFLITLTLALLLGLTAGCAYNRNNPQDPYESYNRKVFKFNRAVDKAIVRPIAKAYDTIIPGPIHRSISNFFSNLGQIPTVGNDLLQANFKYALKDTGRFVANTVFGLGGLFDAATPVGLAKHHNDFGLTMAKWGVHDSPYFLLPFIGPGTIRDQFAFFVDYQFLTAYPYIDSYQLRYSIYGLQIVDDRAAYLSTDKVVDEAFDPYIFIRDAYLQRRDAQIAQVLNKQPQQTTNALIEAAEVSSMESAEVYSNRKMSLK